jgi:5-hydroxyisourate hydrolase-like protein (transthyretin family)
VSDKKKWTKEQWREWGKRKKERDDRREEMNQSKKKFGAWELENHWGEYHEKNHKKII